MDLIGKTAVWGLKRLAASLEKDLQRQVADWSSAPAEEAFASFEAWLIEENESICALVQDQARDRREPGGFSLASVYLAKGRRQVYWLGDCRAYEVRPEAPGAGFRLLTRDQNQLQVALEGQETFTFLQNEIQESSRQLLAYFGQPTTEKVRSILQGQRDPVPMQPGAGLLLITDGVFLPLVRSILDQHQSSISEQDFHLESWLSRFCASRGLFNPEDPHERPGEVLLESLIKATRRYTARKTSYRDDIAGLVLFPPAR